MRAVTKRSRVFVVMAIPTLFSAGAFAAVSAEEAKQLGGPNLTEWGAEKTANKDGTIPAYTGKGVKWSSPDPKGDPGAATHPYNDKPLFSITAQNYQQYADKLDAQAEMFKKFPAYRMDVYQTHRDFVYPKRVLDNSIRNATSCKGVDNDLRLEGCYAGFPFPVPKTGSQVMWNKLINYQGPAWNSPTNCWVVNPGGDGKGKPVLQTYSRAQQEAPIYFPENADKVVPTNAIYWRIVQSNLGPTRKVGEKILIHDSLDMAGLGRRVWQYIPGQRRVKLAPDLAYDTPSPNSGGASTMDDAKGFLGGMNRFDWKLIGKKEKYLNQNAFEFHDRSKDCSDEKTHSTSYFPNPDCMRWELHRVWVVEAKLKPEFRHIYHRRMFYFDEDAPGCDALENYDGNGKLFRIGFQQCYPNSNEFGGGSFDNTWLTDLQTGVWASQGTIGFKGAGWVQVPRWEDTKFSPEAIAGEGIR